VFADLSHAQWVAVAWGELLLTYAGYLLYLAWRARRARRAGGGG